MGTSTAVTEIVVCELAGCDNQFERRANRGVYSTRFCSQTCRTIHLRRLARIRDEGRVLEERVCAREGCDITFTIRPYKGSRRYCSRACRRADVRARTTVPRAPIAAPEHPYPESSPTRVHAVSRIGPGTVAYAQYLRTDYWRRQRLRALQRADHHCQVCSGTTALEVHHNTYCRLGNERLSDLFVLCKTHHAVLHASGGMPTPPATVYLSTSLA